MKFRMLPPVFKIIGLALVLFMLVILLTLKLSDKTVFHIFFMDKIPISRLAVSVFFTGFLLFILAREKVEDEFADFCRLTAFRRLPT